jgi:hypothetical protein
MRLIDEIPEIYDFAQEEDFDSGDLEPCDIDNMCLVLKNFKDGDSKILKVILEHVDSEAEKDCIKRMCKAARKMERKA